MTVYLCYYDFQINLDFKKLKPKNCNNFDRNWENIRSKLLEKIIKLNDTSLDNILAKPRGMYTFIFIQYVYVSI